MSVLVLFQLSWIMLCFYSPQIKITSYCPYYPKDYIDKSSIYRYKIVSSFKNKAVVNFDIDFWKTGRSAWCVLPWKDFSEIKSRQEAMASQMAQGLSPSSGLLWMLSSYARCI